MDETKKNENLGLNVNINLDTTPVLYTDSIFMNANEDGVTFDIMQRVGATNQARIVARVGMSREHAKKFAKELSKILALTTGQIHTGEKKVN